MLDSSASRDRSARMVLIGLGLLGLLLLILVLPPVSLLSGGDDSDTSGGETVSEGGERLATAPEGFEALSELLRPEDVDAPGPYAISVRLVRTVTDGRNLGLYTRRDGEWVRIATAELVFDGTMARGEVSEVPSNVAVFRRVSSAMALHGWLGANAQIDPAAAELVTVLNSVDFAPAADGGLTGIASALPEVNADLIPTVRAANEAETAAVNAILASPQLTDAHVAALVQLAQSPGNQGVDLDYRGIAVAQGPAFSDFVALLAARLRETSRSLTITLPAPVRSGEAWDTGAFDWDALGAQADFIKLVPQPDPATYYESLSGALDFLKGKLEMAKVLLVVGRDSWELSSDGLAPLSLLDALRLASEPEVRTSVITPNAQIVIVGKNIYENDGASGLGWDEAAAAVSFSYPGRGGQRTVWFENALSLAFRLDLAQRYGLGGVAVDDVSLDPAAPGYWEPLRSFVEIGEVDLARANTTLLTPEWTAQAGELMAEPGGNVVWRAPPQPAVYDITLIVSDGVVRVKQSVLLDVREGTTGAVEATPVP
jgi:hypothetical protein